MEVNRDMGSSRERHRDKMSLSARARRPDSPRQSLSTPEGGKRPPRETITLGKQVSVAVFEN